MRTCECALTNVRVAVMCTRARTRAEASPCICSHLSISGCLCASVLVRPAVNLDNRAGNRRGVQPEQVIKKNPCKMATLWPPLGKQRRNVWRGMRARWLPARTRTERFMSFGD